MEIAVGGLESHLSLRKRTYVFLNSTKATSRINKAFNTFIITLILLNILAMILAVVSATLMFYAEHEAQPKTFSSIPAAMWWAVATLTTIGYGDVYPVTITGKLMASVIAVLGIGMFALPTGILGSGFVEELDQHKKTRKCPHCGKEL